MKKKPVVEISFLAAFIIAGWAACASVAFGKDEQVSLKAVPAAVRATIEKYAEGGEVTKIERKEDDGEVIFEVEMDKVGREVEIEVSSTGKLLRGEVCLESVPAAARATIEKFVGAGKITKIEIEVDDDEVIFEVEVAKDGKEIDIEVASTGELVKEEVFLESVPAAVRATIEKFAKGGKVTKIEREVDEGEVSFEAEVTKDGKEFEIEVSPTGELLKVKKERENEIEKVDWSKLPLGLVTLTPDFALTGQGSTLDTIAFWEARDPNGTLMFVTAKGNSLVEVWKYPFVGHELPPLVHSSFGTSPVNGVAVDEDADLLYVAVGEPASTVSVFELPSLKFRFEFVKGAVKLGGEPNICLLKRPDGKTWVYVTSENTIYIHDAKTGREIGRIPQTMDVETVFADNFHQIIYVPDEHGRTGIYAYTPEGQPFLKNGSNRFGGGGIIQRDAEGIWIYSLPADGKKDKGRGFIIVSDQRTDVTDFEFFDRRTWKHLGTLRLTGVNMTDGIASIQKPMKSYPLGLFVAIDDDRSTVGIGWDKVLKAMGIDGD